MPTLNVNVAGGEPLFNIASYARRGLGRRDRLSPAEVALISRTVQRAPEVMVKVLTQGSTNLAAVGAHVDYIGRHGTLALETEEGERLHGRDSADTLIEQWDLDLQAHRRSADLIASVGRRPARLMHKLILSMPAGVAPHGVHQAARRFLRDEFAGKHRYAFVLHTDEPHPHVHVVLKAVSERGVRLHIDKRTLRRWREGFAERLRAVGIEANATDRAVRGRSKDAKHDAIFRAARRGSSTHMQQRVETVLQELSRGRIRVEPGKHRLLSTRSHVEAGWRAVKRALLNEGKRALAEQVDEFLSRMPPARTEKEHMAQALLARAHAIRSKELAPTR
jgi:hypothetical protein